MRISSFAILALSSAPLLQAQSTALREFRIDAGHSEVSFSIGFLGRPVKGRFDDVKGTLVYAPWPKGVPGQSAITVAIGTASINTGSKHRDEHLRSSDFFDAERYPVILFSSSSIRRTRDGFVLSGPLSMHGVTRNVDIPFRPAPAQPIEDPHGSTLMVFAGSVRIAHKDFGILGGSEHNEWFDKLRSATMADTAVVTLEIEVWDPDLSRTKTYDAALARVASNGIESLMAPVRAAYAKDPGSIKGSEWQLSQTGAALLSRGKTSDAIEVLELNAEFFPTSAAAKSALARAYEIAGDTAAARKLTAEALVLDPVDTRALELKRRLYAR